MSDQDSSTSASQTDGELDEVDEETQPYGETEEEKKQGNRWSSSLSSSPNGFSSSLLAVIRIKQKYQALKKRRQELALSSMGGLGSSTGAPVKSSPKIFTFEGVHNTSFAPPTSTTATGTSFSVPQKKKKRRKRRVLFPSSRRRRAPPRQDYNRAKYFLYLLLAIVFVQVTSENTTTIKSRQIKTCCHLLENVIVSPSFMYRCKQPLTLILMLLMWPLTDCPVMIFQKIMLPGYLAMATSLWTNG